MWPSRPTQSPGCSAVRATAVLWLLPHRLLAVASNVGAVSSKWRISPTMPPEQSAPVVFGSAATAASIIALLPPL